MDAIVAVDVASADVTVQAGIRKDDMNAILRKHGLFFPVDPGPGASIGGMCATGCSGTNAVRFGTMKDNVLSLTAVLADGTVVKTGQKARKSSAGFDLTRLLVGSEGCLGIITEVTLRLRPIAEKTAVAIASFETVHDAASAVIEILQRGVDVSCVELMDDTMVRVVNEQSGFSHAERPTLLFKFAGNEAQVAECADRTSEVIKKHGAQGWDWTDEEAEIERIWQARKVALWSAQSAHPDMEVAITDVCLPVSKLAQAVSETKADIDASLLAGRAPIVGHVGDGNFHCFLTFDASNAAEVAEAESLNDRMVRRAIRLGGTCTGEHGIGLGKRQYLREELGDGAVHTMRLLKAAMDPRGILNPGKVIPPV
jgi:D-lactate dehydrogenase (cytochrome)